jgi:Mg-chelatase subunit ChlD
VTRALLASSRAAVLCAGVGLCACAGDDNAGRDAGARDASARADASADASPADSGQGTSGTGGASGTGSGGVGGDPNNCARADVDASRVRPAVMLVVDGSTSMEGAYGSTTRWQAIRDALVGPDTGVVPKLEGLVNFGLAVFGTTPTCPLPMGMIAPALMNAEPITSAFPETPPGLSTPTGRALARVVDSLPDPTVEVDTNLGPQIVVLATDGDPNDCTDFATLNPQPSIDAALKAQSKHQQLYVISVGTDANAEHLQELANIGAGLERFASPGATVYYPDDAEALATTLEKLVDKAVGCDVKLHGPGVMVGQECRGTVTLNDIELECDGADGWKLIDSNHIRLQGSTCEQFKNDLGALVHASFPCEIILVE